MPDGAGARSGVAPPRPRLHALIAVAALCAVLAPLNSTMIAVALPQIRADFSLGQGMAAWLVSAYLIAMAVAQPVAGRLGDQLGRVRVVRLGLVLFLALTVATSLAPTFWSLVLLRVAQALVAAALIPNAIALLRQHVPTAALGRATGLNSAAIAAAAGIGPLLGAAAIAIGSWRYVFPLSLPFAALALALLPRLALGPESRREAAPMDWAGSVLFAALLTGVTLVLTLSHGGVPALQLAVAWASLALLAGAFWWRQRSTPVPAAEWSLFRRRSFAAATGAILLTNLVMYTTLLMVPFLVRDVLEESVGTSGALLGLMALCMGLAAPLGGRLADARGRRVPAQLGSGLLLLAASLMYAALQGGVSTPQLTVLLSLVGAGVGLGTGPATAAAVESAPRAIAGAAAGTSSMMRYVGSIVGAGVLAGFLSSGRAGAPDAGAFLALQIVIVTMALLATVAASLIHTFVEDEPEPTRGAGAVASDDRGG